MFGSMIDSVAGKVNSFETKMALYIVIGIVVIVIVSNLLDGIRYYIRGLDTTALGALFLWLAYKASEIAIMKKFTGLLILVGGTLVASGLLVFIVTRLFRSRGRKRQQEREWDPEIKEDEQEETPAKHMKETE